MKQETPHPSAGETEEPYSFTPEDMVEFSHWSESSEEAYRFWKKNQVSIDMSNSHIEKIKEKRKELLKLWIKTIEKKIHNEQQPYPKRGETNRNNRMETIRPRKH